MALNEGTRGDMPAVKIETYTIDDGSGGKAKIYRARVQSGKSWIPIRNPKPISIEWQEDFATREEAIVAVKIRCREESLRGQGFTLRRILTHSEVFPAEDLFRTTEKETCSG